MRQRKLNGQYTKKLDNLWRMIKDFLLLVLLINILIQSVSNLEHKKVTIINESDRTSKEEAWPEKIQEVAPENDSLVESFLGEFTAYTASADECGKSDGITASGLMVKENETIACPPEITFGTKIKIEGMGIYVCQDRGGAIKNNHFDIYMETKAEAFNFGRRKISYKVL